MSSVLLLGSTGLVVSKLKLDPVIPGHGIPSTRYFYGKPVP
jgi:hypothetical protein